jgi:hypothetical protein
MEYILSGCSPPEIKTEYNRAEDMEQDTSSKIIGGSEAYERMRTGKITPEKAAQETKDEAAGRAGEEIARVRGSLAIRAAEYDARRAANAAHSSSNSADNT